MPKKPPTPFQWPEHYDLDIYVRDDAGDPVNELWTGDAEAGARWAQYLMQMYPDTPIVIQCYRSDAQGNTDTSIWFNLTLEQLITKATLEAR